MGSRIGRSAWLAVIILTSVLSAAAARAVPYAAFVMDARTGQIFYEENAETPLAPASLTKMMTLYLAFQAIQQGEISLDTVVRIPADAADEPPSRLGLRTGQEIKLRYLLRAAAVKSANDAAMAIGYALGGSKEGFAARMNAMAQAMGMTHTHFINPNGLTADGHYSSARDMSILGRHLIYDFPQYYNLFSRRTADAGMAQVSNTNRRFLDAYEGADGIKTGFTNAAGYNLVASAQRGDVRIIATVFGGTSTADRNARVSKLLDLGFAHAPAHAQVVMTNPPVARPQDAATTQVAANIDAPPSDAPARVSGPIETSLRPQPRPGSTVVTFAAAVPAKEIEDALTAALAAPAKEAPTEIIMTATAIAPGSAPLVEPEPEVVTRLSTSGGSLWGINLGSFPSRDSAERALITVALSESTTLNGGLRRVIQRSGGFDANVMGLTRDEADLACRRLQARGTTCFMVGTDE
ncbi:D-alanyl-D-alanine carboxypeptidase family protein [Rubellimicrobium arenae]|uniref:D-alanyl-D-alanine carboxypeptidase family protein n=1 Tax=Rubellimicrobium arenae TaxID=2817372 RepID=UPI001B30D5EC|nr:D-alanyl-D-alanine carboxypeptidase family protein [Rubellimicrobium arenae]